MCWWQPLLLTTITFITVILNLVKMSESIGCFVCYSANRSDPLCEDSFNTSKIDISNRTSKYYQSPCWGYRKDREGYFPADHCIKIEGKVGSQDDGSLQTIIIRTCALDSGSLTADTEIVRISHCGKFNYNNMDYTGCVQSCAKDGCNTAHSLHAPSLLHLLFITALIPFLLNALYNSAHST